MMGLRALVCIVVLAPALAVAQPPPTPAQKQAASDKVKKAIAKSQAGDHETAVDLYLEAYTIIPQPLLLSNVGSEYQQMKKPVEALKYFCKYLEADPTGNNVSYASAQARTLYIELGGDAAAEDDALCRPIVKPKQEEPPAKEVAPDEPLPPTDGPVDTGPKQPTPTLRYVGFGVAVVGVGLFGGGVYFGLKAKSIEKEINEHDIRDPWPPNIQARDQEGRDANKKAIGLMIGGGLAVAAGTVMIVMGGPKASKETSVSIAPVATPDSVGFAAAGRF